MIWLFLLLLCAPALLLAALGMLLGAYALALGFAVIWSLCFAILTAAGAELGMASLAAFGLALPAGWMMLGWVPEVNSG